jgi:hypothetical protein
VNLDREPEDRSEPEASGHEAWQCKHAAPFVKVAPARRPGRA